MPWCPKCKAEYREGFTECATCHVPLVDELPDEQDMEQMPDAVQAEPAPEEAVQLENPIAVYTADSRIDAEMIRDMLRESGIPADMQQVLAQHAGAVTGRRARYTMQVMVGAADTARARALIDETKQALEAVKPVLEGVKDWTEQGLHDAVMAFIPETGLKNGQVLWPLRIAISGLASTPGGAFEIAYLLGREETLRRLDSSLKKL